MRRFPRTASHPTLQAMLELGRAQKTIFVARYLRDRDLQREVEEALNVIEVVEPGQLRDPLRQGGDFASNSRDEQELSVLCLRILQAALVYVNTLITPGRPRRRWMGGGPDAGRPPWPHPIVLRARPALDPPRYAEPAGTGRPARDCIGCLLRVGMVAGPPDYPPSSSTPKPSETSPSRI